MNIADELRIKRKIRRICKVLRQLPEKEQAECIWKMKCCLRVSGEWKLKEHFLDMLIERFGAICR